jgi:hypothetical protein
MVADVMAKAFTEPGIHGPIRVRVRHADGSWKYLEAVGNNLLDNPAVHGVVAGRDITERVVAEEACAQRRPLPGAGPEPVGRDHDRGTRRRLVYSSPAAERLFGFEERRRELDDPMARSIRTTGPRWWRCPARREGGTDPVSFRLRIADGSFRDVEAIVQDLTDDPSVGGVVADDATSPSATAPRRWWRARLILRLIAEGSAGRDARDDLLRGRGAGT